MSSQINPSFIKPSIQSSDSRCPAWMSSYPPTLLCVHALHLLLIEVVDFADAVAAAPALARSAETRSRSSSILSPRLDLFTAISRLLLLRTGGATFGATTLAADKDILFNSIWNIKHIWSHKKKIMKIQKKTHTKRIEKISHKELSIKNLVTFLKSIKFV